MRHISEHLFDFNFVAEGIFRFERSDEEGECLEEYLQLVEFDLYFKFVIGILSGLCLLSGWYLVLLVGLGAALAEDLDDSGDAEEEREILLRGPYWRTNEMSVSYYITAGRWGT